MARRKRTDRDPVLDRPQVTDYAAPADPDPDAPDPADQERGGWPAQNPPTTKAGKAGREG